MKPNQIYDNAGYQVVNADQFDVVTRLTKKEKIERQLQFIKRLALSGYKFDGKVWRKP